MLQKAVREVFTDRLCSSVHLLSGGFRREGDVLKEMVGFLTEESKIFPGLLAQCLALFLFILLLIFLVKRHMQQ